MVRNYNIVFFLNSLVSSLIKTAEVLIHIEEFNSTFKLIEKINEEFKEFTAAQEDLDTVQSFLSVLVDLESFINDKDKLESIEEIIKEVSSYLDKIYFSEIDFIVNNKYIGLAQNYEDKNDYDKSIEYYKKVLKLLLLYPDFQKNKTIMYELGKGYLGLGNRQRELNQIDEAIKSSIKGLDYLTKFNLNKNESTRLLDILIANSNLAQLYFENEEYNESLKILERQDKIIRNFIEDIEDESLLQFFLEELYLRFLVLQQLERYNQQKEILEDFLFLFDKDLIESAVFDDAILYLNSFINMNKDVSKSPGIWSWKNYIQKIFNILMENKISRKLPNFGISIKSDLLDLSFSYIEYCLDLNKSIPDDILTQTINLAHEICEYFPDDTPNILETIKDLEWIRDQQRSIIPRSFTKKKKVYKKRGKKTVGRNKRKKKKRK